MAGSWKTSHTMTTAIPANQRPTQSAHEDAPALVAEHDRVGGRVTDAVDLGGGKGEVAAPAGVPDEAGGAHTAQPRTQAFVLGQQVGGHRGGGLLPGLG